MQEAFLHFIWKFQYFDKAQLHSTQGELLEIQAPGQHNGHAGADFSQARIRLDGIEWVGDVEIHLKASDWRKHAHHENPAYNKVVLHVVWEADEPALRKDGTTIPALELKQRIDTALLHRYQALLQAKGSIPCHAHLAEVPDILKISMRDQAAVRRLEQKAALLHSHWEANGQDWEETCYQILAQAFGFKVNSEAMLALAKRTPLKIIQKHRLHLIQIEALLMGQAGFLTEESLEEPYYQKLRKEYLFLQHKYQLSPLPAAMWKWARLRPVNFPTIRLAQWAMLLHRQQSFFSLFTEESTLPVIRKALQAEVSDFWQSHYRFEEASEASGKQIGKEGIESLIINTAIPLLALLAKEKRQNAYLERALGFLEQLKAENNQITRLWTDLGLENRSAFDSQALIEQYKNFCSLQRCFECSIGTYLLKPRP